MAIYKVINGKGTQTHGAMMNVLKYILNPNKTEPNLNYVTSFYDYDTITPKNIYRSFLDTKKVWDNEDGRQYIHSILSWNKGDNISPENALQFAIRFAEHIYPGHQCAIAIHTDSDNTVHAHLVCNTVSCLDGHKLQKSKSALKKDKDYCNALCKEYGLSIAQKGKHFDGSDIEPGTIISWAKNTYRLLASSKQSYIAECGLAVMKSLEQAYSKSTFIDCMKKLGWKSRWEDNRKNITFENTEGKRVRDSTLVKMFSIPATKEGLTNELERQRAAREQRQPGAGVSDLAEEAKSTTRRNTAASANSPTEGRRKPSTKRGKHM